MGYDLDMDAGDNNTSAFVTGAEASTLSQAISGGVKITSCERKKQKKTYMKHVFRDRTPDRQITASKIEALSIDRDIKRRG